jgi:hypothetical protein
MPDNRRSFCRNESSSPIGFRGIARVLTLEPQARNGSVSDPKDITVSLHGWACVVPSIGLCAPGRDQETARQAAQGQESRGRNFILVVHLGCCITGLQKEITGACGHCKQWMFFASAL